MRRFPRTIRLDNSDLRAFPLAAEPGEWALPGSFMFAHATAPETLPRKERLAFATGWLGLHSLGFSTFVAVAAIDDEAYGRLTGHFANILQRRFSAPTRNQALAAARTELEYASELCEHKINTILAIERDIGDGGIKETFRVVTPARAEDHAKIWDIVPEQGV